MKENINPLRRIKMSKTMKSFGLILFFIALAGAPLLAQDAAAGSAAKASLFRLSLILGAGVITLSVFIGAFCQAKAISAACEGISRNPLGAPHIRFLLIFGLVLIETLVIYALLITIIILMVQWNKYPGV
jgi:F-type H+-transporting ATPase subunit c